MFFWFIGTSIATIWFVFHDKKFAYRLVVAGALAPDAIEVFLGHAGPLHSLVTMVAIMAVVMLITYGRKKSVLLILWTRKQVNKNQVLQH